VNILYGFAHGSLTATCAQFRTQDKSGIVGDPEAGDALGSAVT